LKTKEFDRATAPIAREIEHEPAGLPGKALPLGCLLVARAPRGIGQTYRLTKSETIIGRGAGVDLFLEDDGMSRRHAKIQVTQDGDYWLVDLGSTNGSYVNGNRVVSWKLSNGDRIELGAVVVLRFGRLNPGDEKDQGDVYQAGTRDMVTGIFNRRFFLEMLDQEHAFCCRHQLATSVALLDVDHLSHINADHGFSAGDRVLRDIANRVRSMLRREDVFARYGGDELAVLMRQMPAAAAALCAERLRQAVEQTAIDFEGVRLSVTVSGGYATLLESSFPTGADLLAEAGRQLLLAKKAGCNCIRGAQV
jgi:two-component system cell cycle response regulator